MNDLYQFVFIVEQEQPETDAGKRYHTDLHVSSVLSHGTGNSFSLQQSHTSYHAIQRSNFVIRVNLLSYY